MTVNEIKDGAHLLLLLVSPFHGQAQVRSVERGNEDTRVFQLQLVEDVLPRDFVGSGSEGDHRYAWKFLAQHLELGIFRTEVMSPLGDAMRLVDGKEGYVDVFQQEIHFAHQAFGRDIEQLDASLQAILA